MEFEKWPACLATFCSFQESLSPDFTSTMIPDGGHLGTSPKVAVRRNQGVRHRARQAARPLVHLLDYVPHRQVGSPASPRSHELKILTQRNRVGNFGLVSRLCLRLRIQIGLGRVLRARTGKHLLGLNLSGFDHKRQQIRPADAGTAASSDGFDVTSRLGSFQNRLGILYAFLDANSPVSNLQHCRTRIIGRHLSNDMRDVRVHPYRFVIGRRQFFQ